MTARHASTRWRGAARIRCATVGFTLVEMVVVLAMAAVLLAIALPQLRPSPTRTVQWAARQLVNDLELVRTRALATKRGVRVAFNAADAYVGFLDDDGDGTFAESVAETQALRGFGTRTLDALVRFGRGSAPALPGETGTGPVTFPNDRVDFDSRGITVPQGARGSIYLVHRDYPDAVAAVSISGSASFKVWAYRDGAWQ